jgi:hypothetical protein
MNNPGPITVAVRCSAHTKAGTRCKNDTLRSTLCWVHLKSKDHLRIKKSAIEKTGFGLYTTIPLVRGQNICEYGGAIVVDPPGNWVSHYALQIKKHPLTFIDAKKTNTAPGRYANSGGRLNDAQLIFDRRNQIAHVRATKRIPVGGEIFVPYGRSYGRL